MEGLSSSPTKYTEVRTTGRRQTRSQTQGGVKSDGSVKAQTPTRSTPSTSTTRTQVPQQSLCSRVVYAIPGGIYSLLCSGCRVLKEDFIESLCTYATFSLAPGIAGAFSKLTGLSFNGLVGVITVTGRKRATKIATALWNRIPSLRRRPATPATPANSGSSKADTGDQDKKKDSADKDLPGSLKGKPPGEVKGRSRPKHS